MALMYCRTYLTQDGMTHLFGLGQGSISRNIALLVPVIRRSVPLPQKIYQKARRSTTVEDLEELFPGMIALTDASEQPIRQPKRSDMKKSHYSAKAKIHTVKVQYTTSFDGLIVHKTSHSPAGGTTIWCTR